MTVGGKNSNIQEPKMLDKVEKAEGKVQQVAKEVAKETKEGVQVIKDKLEGNLKSGKAEKFIDIFEMPKTFPAGFVESIRESEGLDRDEKLLNFQKKIDNMSEKELKLVRDYLVKEMASPKNNDDQLLGALLNAVNRELDSRENNLKPIPFPPGIIDKPWPPKHPGTCNPGGGFPKPMPTLEDIVPLNKKLD